MKGFSETTGTGERREERVEPCMILVAYEDGATRDRAMLVCDHLVGNFWSDISFRFSWWKFSHLADSIIASEAAGAAARADMMIFSAHSTSQLTPAVRAWMEAWLPQRELRDSLLVALVGLEEDSRKGLTPTHIYLKHIARRGRMDYLPLVLHSVTDTKTNSVEMLLKRARESSPILEDIIHRRPPPPPWGINE